MKTQTIVIAWVDMDGSEPTGRLIRPDGVNTVAEHRRAPKAHAVVWLNSGTEEDVAKALAHAAAMRRDEPDLLVVEVVTFPEAVVADPLGLARAAVLLALYGDVDAFRRPASGTSTPTTSS